MAIGIEKSTARERYGLLVTALAPVIPQILGSAFNIWYNATVIEPLLTPALKQRFFEAVVLYNSVVYPVGVFLWIKRIFSFRDLLHCLRAGRATNSESLMQARRRLIHLPWFAAAICLMLCSAQSRRTLECWVQLDTIPNGDYRGLEELH